MDNALMWVYAAALGIGLVYSLLQLFGHSLDGVFDAFHLDFHVGDHGDFGVSTLAIAWFLASFGAAGLIAQLGGAAGTLVSLLVAAGGGLLFGAVAQFVLVKYLSETTSTNVETSALVGKVAEIFTPIEPEHMGQILLVVQGSRMTFSARAIKRDMTLVRGQRVRIAEMTGSVAYVEPMNGVED